MEIGTDQAVLTGIEEEQAPSQALLAVAVVVLPGGQQGPSCSGWWSAMHGRGLAGAVAAGVGPGHSMRRRTYSSNVGPR
jgi:hypothetical protein